MNTYLDDICVDSVPSVARNKELTTKGTDLLRSRHRGHRPVHQGFYLREEDALDLYDLLYAAIFKRVMYLTRLTVEYFTLALSIELR